MEQDCTKRCIVYETWCITCERREREKILEEEVDEEKQREKFKRIKISKYIGETSRSAYERGLEHLKDFEDMKAESHMIKHYLENHEDEEMMSMEFGMRIVRKPRTAFNRQIAESVMIQSNKNHNILNSKSEYNRCALPRLATKMGEESLAKLEKMRREEKTAEDEYEQRVRRLRMKTYKERREKPTRMEQPAEKKRKLGTNEYTRVLQNNMEQEKRKEEEEHKTFPIFNSKRRRKNEKPEETKPAPKNDLETVDERDWDREVWLKDEEKKRQAEARDKRIAEARKKEKSYELLRLCKQIMEKEGTHWKKSQERRELEKNELAERTERLQRAENKKQKTLSRIRCNKIQEKITSSLESLPENKRKILRMRENKEKAILLKEARREVWTKWRQSKGKMKVEKVLEAGEHELEKRLEMIRKEVENYEREQEEQRKGEEEKKRRLERSKKKAQQWEMLRWIVTFITKNEQRWEIRRKMEEERREEEERKDYENWIKLKHDEKVSTLREKHAKQEKIKLNREQRLLEAQRLKRIWREERSAKDEEETAAAEEAESTEVAEDKYDEEEKWPEEGDWEKIVAENAEAEAADQVVPLDLSKEGFLQTEGFCLSCVHDPCVCALVKLELKLQMLREKKQEEAEVMRRGRKRKNSDPVQREVVEAGGNESEAEASTQEAEAGVQRGREAAEAGGQEAEAASCVHREAEAGVQRGREEAAAGGREAEAEIEAVVHQGSCSENPSETKKQFEPGQAVKKPKNSQKIILPEVKPEVDCPPTPPPVPSHSLSATSGSILSLKHQADPLPPPEDDCTLPLTNKIHHGSLRTLRPLNNLSCMSLGLSTLLCNKKPPLNPSLPSTSSKTSSDPTSLPLNGGSSGHLGTWGDPPPSSPTSSTRGGAKPRPEKILMKKSPLKHSTITRAFVVQRCPIVPSAIPAMKSEDDQELYSIFKKRRLAETTTLVTKNQEAEKNTKNVIIAQIPCQRTTPPTKKTRKTTNKPQKSEKQTPKTKKTIKKEPTEPCQNIRKYFKKPEISENTYQNKQTTIENNQTTLKTKQQHQENPTTKPKMGEKSTKIDKKQNQNENKITKCTTKQTTPKQYNNKQENKQQESNSSKHPVEPTKMAVKIKGTLITDMNDFLRKKKAERDRKFLAEKHPSKLRSSVPPAVLHPTTHPPSAQNSQVDKTLTQIESESGATNGKNMKVGPGI